MILYEHSKKRKSKNIDLKSYMKLIKSVMDFLIFNWTKSYKITIPVSDFVYGLENAEYKKRNIEGEISESSFELFFISDLALNFPTKIPLLQIKGEIERNKNFSQLRIMTSIQGFVKFIFLIAVCKQYTF